MAVLTDFSSRTRCRSSCITSSTDTKICSCGESIANDCAKARQSDARGSYAGPAQSHFGSPVDTQSRGDDTSGAPAFDGRKPAIPLTVGESVTVMCAFMKVLI